MKMKHNMNAPLYGIIATGILLLQAGSGNAADTPKDSQSSKPKIEILKVPDASVKPGTDDTGEIKGKVSGLPSFNSYQVVVYSKGGQTWYVQPNTSTPVLKIDDNGEFSAHIFGGTEYAALLTKDSYQPKATLDQLPLVGGDVLDRDVKKPEKAVK